jgi:UDP-N-acetylmuramyl tripeptide synthase
MANGVVTALAADPAAPLAALEVDEAHLPALVQQTGARQVVLMNLSRDQLDRGSEVRMLAGRWREMAAGLPPGVLVIANADDPMVAWAAMAAPEVLWVGSGQWWVSDSALCPACGEGLERVSGAWSCPGCGLARPEATWLIDLEAGAVVGPGGVWPVELAVPGRFNLSNAAMAAAAASGLGVEAQVALAAAGQVSNVDGRYSETVVGSHPVRLLLGKNPASWAETIGLVAGSEATLCTVLNARGADGRDPSWIWDVPFEQLAPRDVWVGGERRFDLAVRLDVAGLTVRGVSEDPLEALVGLAPGTKVDLVANYTAFQELRARVVGS